VIGLKGINHKLIGMGWIETSLVIVIIILRMMSELNKDGHKIDSTSTQTFILKKHFIPNQMQTL
jgi:hypothetical protein